MLGLIKLTLLRLSGFWNSTARFGIQEGIAWECEHSISLSLSLSPSPFLFAVDVYESSALCPDSAGIWGLASVMGVLLFVWVSPLTSFNSKFYIR